MSETIEDDYGSTWAKCHEHCGMCVVRPGKVQCDCDGFDRWLVEMARRYGYELTFKEDGDHVELRIHKADVLRLVGLMDDQTKRSWLTGIDDDGKVMYIPDDVSVEGEVFLMRER